MAPLARGPASTEIRHVIAVLKARHSVNIALRDQLSYIGPEVIGNHGFLFYLWR